MIIDYQLSNLFSVQHVFDYLGVAAEISSDPQKIATASALVLPGVGAFADAMDNLKKLKLVAPLKKAVRAGKPLMGVCLGLQLLFEESDEFGLHQGLGLVKGKVRRFPQPPVTKIPHMGWNQLFPHQQSWQNTPFSHLSEKDFLYFVHSYYVLPQDPAAILSYTNYSDFKFCSAILQKNIFATQFHPEKSATKGVLIYKNWLQSI